MRVDPIRLLIRRLTLAAALTLAFAPMAVAQTTQPPGTAAQPTETSSEPVATPPGASSEPAATPAEAEAPKAPLKPFVATGPVHVPNFWDPNNRPEKPNTPIAAIRFLTSDGFPPFNFVSADGRLTGFNVELARAICEALEAECTIQMRPFEELVTALEEKRGDAIIAGLAVTTANRDKLAFSRPYLRLPARFVVRAGADLAATPTGLANKWIATVGNTAHEAFLHAFFRDARIITYPSSDIARAALRNGEVDVYFGSGLSLSFWLAGSDANGCCQFLGGPFLDPTFFGMGLTVAVAHDNDDLRKAIDYALHRVHEEGRYGELYLRYFPVSFF